MTRFLIICIFLRATAIVSGHGGRIVNGKPAAGHEFPALASLHVNGSHYCGANVLSENWLVTAAHCVRTSLPSQQYIRTHRPVEGPSTKWSRESYTRTILD
ncbi:complement factor D-like [Schistocerca americana]|uniref:complement factor D-like n=1 Tax=Schistocerca americana TaxID=7009 RepID=UPI001F4F955C|nr:complement factor D-like [Schistocerca americana]